LADGFFSMPGRVLFLPARLPSSLRSAILWSRADFPPIGVAGESHPFSDGSSILFSHPVSRRILAFGRYYNFDSFFLPPSDLFLTPSVKESPLPFPVFSDLVF